MLWCTSSVSSLFGAVIKVLTRPAKQNNIFLYLTNVCCYWCWAAALPKLRLGREKIIARRLDYVMLIE